MSTYIIRPLIKWNIVCDSTQNTLGFIWGIQYLPIIIIINTLATNTFCFFRLISASSTIQVQCKLSSILKQKFTIISLQSYLTQFSGNSLKKLWNHFLWGHTPTSRSAWEKYAYHSLLATFSRQDLHSLCINLSLWSMLTCLLWTVSYTAWQCSSYVVDMAGKSFPVLSLHAY